MKAISAEEFVRVLIKFADDPDDILFEGDFVTGRLNGREVSLHLQSDEDGTLYCQEKDANPVKAFRWLSDNLAKLDLLADRILAVNRPNEHFVRVASNFDGGDSGVGEGEYRVESTSDEIADKLSRSSDFATQVVYLLSEAGDGKTELMNRIAYQMAQRYKETKRGPLFLPVKLDGKPFLRIDDLVVGVLANKYRFRYFYFDAIIELVRLGLLVIGLDGFEEMIVEGKEERVISSLGQLLSRFESSGRLIISARKAFFDYALKDQIPLLEAIRARRVEFVAYKLCQWDERAFLDLVRTYNVSEVHAKKIYSRIISVLKPGHPMLVRPVLACHLVDILLANKDEDEGLACFLRTIAETGYQQVVKEFVSILVHREAAEKWVVVSGDRTGLQVLSERDHMRVLDSLAEEMWLSGVESVRESFLKDWMELVASELNMSPTQVTYCRDKILHHAMLVHEGDDYMFCHEEFRRYFLGEKIADCVVSENTEFLFERLVQRDVLEDAVVAKVAFDLHRKGLKAVHVLKFFDSVRGGQSGKSTMGQNIGAILLAFIRIAGNVDKIIIKDVFFDETSARDFVCCNVEFVNCVFEALGITRMSKVQNVIFNNCECLRLKVENEDCIADMVFSTDSCVRSVEYVEADYVSYEPDAIKRILNANKWCNNLKEVDKVKFSDVDDEIYAIRKVFVSLGHASAVSAKILERRFGRRWPRMRDEFIPKFIKDHILETQTWSGGGMDSRYGLGVNVAALATALDECHGSYGQLLVNLRKRGVAGRFSRE